MKLAKRGARQTSALLACAVSLLLVVVLVALSPAPSLEDDPRPSSYFATDSGGKGCFLVLRRLFPTVARWNQSFRLLEYGIDSELESILVMGPTRPLTPLEAAALDDWIGDGGQLVVVADRPWPVQEKPKWEILRTPPGKTSRTEEPGPEPEDYLKGHGFEFLAARAKVDSQSERFLSHFALKEGDYSVLLETGAGVVAGLKEIGAGQLVVVADSLAFSNLRLKERPSNLTWLARVIDDWGSRRVDFDEYHLGLGERRPFLAVLGSFSTTPWGLGCLQLGLAGLVYLLGTRRRFGRIQDPDPVSPRDPMTLLESRAGLLRAARARQLVVQLIERHRQRGQSRRFAVASDGGDLSQSEREYQSILVRSERRAGGLSDADLLRLARLAGNSLRSLQ